MAVDGPLAIVVQGLAGVSLAACCGLRAFLPPLLLGLAARFGISEFLLGRPLLSPSFGWLASTPVLVVFGTAVVVEILADKVPALDHLLDVVQTLVRPLFGALVVAAALGRTSPTMAVVLGLVAGAPTAAAVHVGKAKIRLLSTLGTGGLASPVLSVLEDIATVFGSVLALVFSVLAFLIIVAGLIVVWRVVRRFVSRVGRLRQDLQPP